MKIMMLGLLMVLLMVSFVSADSDVLGNTTVEVLNVTNSSFFYDNVSFMNHTFMWGNSTFLGNVSVVGDLWLQGVNVSKFGFVNGSDLAVNKLNGSSANFSLGEFVNVSVLGNLRGGNLSANDINLSTLGDPVYGSVEDWFSTTQSSGKISGGGFTSNGVGGVNVAGGSGVIRATASTVAEAMFFDWDAEVNVVLVDDKTNYIYVDYSGGTPDIVSTVTKSDANNIDSILLGKIFRDGVTLHMVEAGMLINDLARNVLTRFTQMGGEIQRASGFVISETGARYLVSTNGVLFAGLTRITTDRKSVV